jgi:hypothetical protein
LANADSSTWIEFNGKYRLNASTPILSIRIFQGRGAKRTLQAFRERPCPAFGYLLAGTTNCWTKERLCECRILNRTRLVRRRGSAPKLALLAKKA